MKKLIAALLLMAMTACTSRTAYGPCIGAFDKEDPKLAYQPNVWNVIVGIFFVETIVVPAIVIANETKCPEGKIQ